MVLDNVKRYALSIAQEECSNKDTLIAALGILFTKLSNIDYAYDLEKWYNSDAYDATEYKRLVEKLTLSNKDKEVGKRLIWCVSTAPQFYNED